MKLPGHSTPIIPKRRLVSPHSGSWKTEPEDRQIDRNQYKNQLHGNVNPWIMQQLQRNEKFNVTAFER
jgi:hypothetical protein